MFRWGERKSHHFRKRNENQNSLSVWVRFCFPFFFSFLLLLHSSWAMMMTMLFDFRRGRSRDNQKNIIFLMVRIWVWNDIEETETTCVLWTCRRWGPKTFFSEYLLISTYFEWVGLVMITNSESALFSLVRSLARVSLRQNSFSSIRRRKRKRKRTRRFFLSERVSEDDDDSTTEGFNNISTDFCFCRWAMLTKTNGSSESDF